VNRGRVSASNPHQLLVLMVLASILLTVIAYVFLRNQLRPIKRLADAAEAFGKGRILPYRPRGAAEVRAAGMAFLDMRARIERQIEQRTLMLSGVSHDLRTPITRMKLELAMLDPGPRWQALQADLAVDGTDAGRLS
jgi:two-component system, OmpR family, osmolarity sensor histidine kinase EnvZ